MNARAVEIMCVLMSALIIRMATHASVRVTRHFHRMDKSVEVYTQNNTVLLLFLDQFFLFLYTNIYFIFYTASV